MIFPFGFLSSGDADVTKFLVATGITDTTQINAVTKLVSDWKSAGLWNNTLLFNPVLGGTSTTHKYNLKDARDVDAAYRLSFTGTWTHSSTGMKGDGSTAYANTFLVPSSVLNLNSKTIGYYSRNSGTSGTIFGSVDGSGRGDFFQPNATGSGDNYSSVSCSSNSKSTGTTNTGLHLAWRNNSSEFYYSRNAGTKVTDVTTSSYNSAFPYFVNAKNLAGSYAQPSNYECAFLFVMNRGISDSEATTIYNIIQTYQTSLGRNI